MVSSLEVSTPMCPSVHLDCTQRGGACPGSGGSQGLAPQAPRLETWFLLVPQDWAPGLSAVPHV